MISLRRFLPLCLLLGCSTTRGAPPVEPPAPSAEPSGSAVHAPEKTVAEPIPEITSEEALAEFDAVWQAVNDQHFDPTFNGVDWAAVREEFRPRAERAQSLAEARDLIREMLDRLGQSHFVLFPAEVLAEAGVGAGADEDAEVRSEEVGTLGFDVRLRGGEALVSDVDPEGAALEAGVAPGWTLSRIGDLSVAESIQALSDSDPRRAALLLREALRGRLRGPIGSREELTFQDGQGREVELELERKKLEAVPHQLGTALPMLHLEFDSETYERSGKKIGWIRFTNWFLPMIQPINEAIDRMRAYDGLVIDLRGNSGGAASMVMGIAGNFFGEITELGVTQMREGTLRIVAIPRKTDLAGERVEPFSGPVAILIDETTGSASELFAGGVQSVGRAHVFGETSAGAVLPATLTRLPSGDVLMHALGDFKTADGTALEGRGVVPDEVVPLTREDLLAGRDPQLEAALAWIAARQHP